MKIAPLLLTLVVVVATAGCATASPPEPVRLDELLTLSGQGLADDVLIAQIEQRGVAFVLSPQDLDAQRAAGVSEGVLRYLQGRASGEQALRIRILGGRYRVPGYDGWLYRGYPYLGYHDGAHYYGDARGYGGQRYFHDNSGNGLWGHHSGHIGVQHGGHHGGRH